MKIELTQKNILQINNNPTLDEIWDFCTKNFLYNQEKYIHEIFTLFKKLGISKKSRIADLSAGGGFPSLNLIKHGYKVDCFDGFASDLFNKNSKKYGLNIKCKKLLWKNIPNVISTMQYDFVFCRGNSFIFAGGGWEKLTTFNIKKVQTEYIKTIKIFYNILKKNGYMYIDKFKDNEIEHNKKLAKIKVKNQLQNIVFSSKRTPETKIRKVSMQRVAENNVVDIKERITYDLSEGELIKFLKNSGFSEIKKINSDFSEEKYFDIWIAKK